MGARDTDAFVTKLGASGSTLVYSINLGGNETDVGRAIAVDGSGNAYVTGQTSSSIDFPTSDAIQESNAGPYKRGRP
ncbi:MAG: SBBP repeat-containing protein [Candidatus Binatia bacterium]